MQIYKSELFGDIKQPDTFFELLELITLRYDEEDPFNVKMWRGQGDINWKIDSGAYRRVFYSQDEEVKEKDIMNYELTLLKQAKHKGFGYSEGRKLSDFELLAKLQHHGAATRLVDFSKNCLVALWFCINNSFDKTGLLYGIYTDFLAGEVEGSIRNSEANYNDFILRTQKNDNPFFIEPPVVSPRIAAQHGVFLYSSLSPAKTGSLKLATEDHGNIFVAISPKLKVELKEILSSTFDIRGATLFPDLDGFSTFHGASIHTNEIWRW
ncbi:FRG domain-containing protein [Priestia megaterium]